MSRKKGFKVKRSRRNLYKKRKSTGRKIFDGVLFVVILGAFVFVGYSVASPLIKFFGGNGNNSSVSEPAWTPARIAPRNIGQQFAGEHFGQHVRQLRRQ